MQSIRRLRHRTTGVVYGYNRHMALNKNLEEFTDYADVAEPVKATKGEVSEPKIEQFDAPPQRTRKVKLMAEETPAE